MSDKNTGIQTYCKKNELKLYNLQNINYTKKKRSLNEIS